MDASPLTTLRLHATEAFQRVQQVQAAARDIAVAAAAPAAQPPPTEQK